jgi:hypothetical protein
MPNNLFPAIPAACVCKKAATFAELGLDVTNIQIIFLVGDPLKSWKPGRTINGITAFEQGKGYYIIPKLTMDLSEYLTPPLGASDDAITWEEGGGDISNEL